MAGVLSGFAVIVALVALGWILARTDVLGDNARIVINRLVFYVATPALLLDALARTTLDQVFTGVFVVSAVSAIIIAVLYAAIARMWLRTPAADLVVGALSAGYVNSANLGIPIALYVLGDLGFVILDLRQLTVHGCYGQVNGVFEEIKQRSGAGIVTRGRYAGDWKAGEMEGRGEARYSNGNTYSRRKSLRWM